MNGRKTTENLFQFFTSTILPAVAIIASIKQPQLATALVVIAVASMVLSIAPRLRTVLSRAILGRKQRTFVGNAYAELVLQVRKFGTFVSSNGPSAIVESQVCHNNYSDYGELGLPRSELFKELWSVLEARLSEELPDVNALKYGLSWFNSLIGQYCRYLVCPLYANIPAKLPARVQNNFSIHVHDELVQCREAFVAFLQGYEDFLTRLNEDPNKTFISSYHFEKPKPLQPFQRAANV